MKKRWLQLAAAFGFAITGYGQLRGRKLPSDYPYCPAVISTNDGPHRELTVFPLRGKPFRIPLRSVSAVTFSPDGRALYGSCTPDRDQEKDGDAIRIAVCKVDLYTGNTTPTPGTVQDLHGSLSSSHISRVFALTLPDGIPTVISLPADGQPWLYISLSPDGQRAVAVHNRRVQLVDIVRGTNKPLGDKWFIAAWSPDGKWLACVENGEQGRTVLMNAATLAIEHVLGNSELDWSPDSHYLLGIKRHDGCRSIEGGTFEAIDISNGSRTTIGSSGCQVDGANTGWVRCDISAR
jgi:WD40 repeat protein